MAQKKRPTSKERIIFAKNFRDARIAAGLSQRQITDLVGMSHAFISEVETGKSTINVDNMATLANLVGVPLWKLLKPVE